ncbi:MAG TPA: DUF5009 domain-containing protein [Verrucomicrobiaceae bacterium]|jgi:predicted acyltransferase
MTSPSRELSSQSDSLHEADSAPPGRVLSVDALRGFDMFWIMGAVPIVHALEQMNKNSFTAFLSTQLSHSTWEGLRFYDLIFPLFLFLVGVSIVFSLDRALAREGRGAAVKRIVRRSILLFLLGIFYMGGLAEKWPGIALGGVLHRIAACYLLAALIYVFWGGRAKVMAGIAAIFLIGYWALVTWVPVPDFKLDKTTVAQLAKRAGSDAPMAITDSVPGRISGSYEEGRNLTNHLDFLLLPGKKAQTYYINEGLLSTLPSVAICLFGIFTGRLLKTERLSPRQKVMRLLVAGAVSVAIGWLWSLQFPLIKRIWTSSFCLVAGGISAMLLAVFYQIVDVWRFQKWCRPFVWMGMNSITIYLAANLVGFNKIAERFVGGDVKAFLDTRVAQGFGQLVIALVGLALAVLLCWFLHRKKIFLRV